MVCTGSDLWRSCYWQGRLPLDLVAQSPLQPSLKTGQKPLTCFISLFSLVIPLLSVLVAPECPISWIEIAGLDEEESTGRTKRSKWTFLKF